MMQRQKLLRCWLRQKKEKDKISMNNKTTAKSVSARIKKLEDFIVENSIYGCYSLSMKTVGLKKSIVRAYKERKDLLNKNFTFTRRHIKLLDDIRHAYISSYSRLNGMRSMLLPRLDSMYDMYIQIIPVTAESNGIVKGYPTDETFELLCGTFNWLNSFPETFEHWSIPDITRIIGFECELIIKERNPEQNNRFRFKTCEVTIPDEKQKRIEKLEKIIVEKGSENSQLLKTRDDVDELVNAIEERQGCLNGCCTKYQLVKKYELFQDKWIRYCDDMNQEANSICSLITDFPLPDNMLIKVDYIMKNSPVMNALKYVWKQNAKRDYTELDFYRYNSKKTAPIFHEFFDWEHWYYPIPDFYQIRRIVPEFHLLYNYDIKKGDSNV
jgi:hypothetical protein